MRIVDAPLSRVPPAAVTGVCQQHVPSSRRHDRHGKSHLGGFQSDAVISGSGGEVMTSANPTGDHHCPRTPRATTSSLRHRLSSLSLSISHSMIYIIACLLLLQPASAVLIKFENCLPDSYIYNVPKPLQWVPLYVDAAFDTEDPQHNLKITLWGNVTGSWLNVTLPPSTSPDWSDPTKLDGKILAEPEPDVPKPKLTTLHSKVNFLTYEPFSLDTDFCNTSLRNGTCPLGPVFDQSLV